MGLIRHTLQGPKDLTGFTTADLATLSITQGYDSDSNAVLARYTAAVVKEIHSGTQSRSNSTFGDNLCDLDDEPQLLLDKVRATGG